MGGFLVGWAKPTPVITRNFKNIRRDDTLVTLAGPVSNLLIAFVGFLGMAILIFVTRGGVLRKTQWPQTSRACGRYAAWRSTST